MKIALLLTLTLVIKHTNAFAYIDKYNPSDTGSILDLYIFFILIACSIIGYSIKKIVTSKTIRTPIKRWYRTYCNSLSITIKQKIENDLTELFQGLDHNLPAVKELQKMCLEGLIETYPNYDNQVIKKCIFMAIDHLKKDPNFTKDCETITNYFNSVESKSSINNIFSDNFPKARCIFGSMIGLLVHTSMYGDKVGIYVTAFATISCLIPICIALYRDAKHKQLIYWLAFISTFIPLGFIVAIIAIVWAAYDKPNVILPQNDV